MKDVQMMLINFYALINFIKRSAIKKVKEQEEKIAGFL
jgi:hypothetical protein